jgi:hypothetical protein
MQVLLTNSRGHAVRQMTPAQLLDLWTYDVVYLKTGTFNGEHAFMVCGADGRPLEIVDSIELALEAVVENGFRLTSVH